ncbi:hypothetical protein [Liquorilactobacillus satsumensis]|uniref:hypothetical protein n=1 Tax=Liquorilactobacillus satsumensis TaxID=259059 RepID=UPI00070505DD|nr:hypothetical protein [Liquorilactobacillus satsumensis]
MIRTKTIHAGLPQSLDRKVQEVLVNMPSELVQDIKFAIASNGETTEYCAMIIYKVNEGD